VNAASVLAPVPPLWSPFRNKAFAVIWAATVISNIGSWMYSAAAAWLMTTVDPDPLMVSLVQVAASLPVFLFALPAGALADIVDRRRLLIGSEYFITIVSIIFAVMVWQHHVTPLCLLLFTFLIESGSAAIAPAWQSTVPTLVPTSQLSAAVTMNSVGVNISRAVGPALGGAATVALGIAAPFWFNVAGNVASIGALTWWKEAPRPKSGIASERFLSAIRIGVRHARFNQALRATLARAIGFLLFASCYWALLPLVAERLKGGGAALYGVLLGSIGVGAITGVFALPWLKRMLGPNRLVAVGSFGTAVALALYAIAEHPATAALGSLLAGACWIAVLSNLNISAQIALPDWVRARGLAVYVTVFFGALTLGSILWGQIARFVGVPLALCIAAAGTVVVVALTWRWKLQMNPLADLTPAMHWPTPLVDQAVNADSGPVFVLVEYRIKPESHAQFLSAINAFAQERGRDGAYAWNVYEDITTPGRMVETFQVDSWLEHLRQHERVTNADRALEQVLRECTNAAPIITHWIAPRQ